VSQALALAAPLSRVRSYVELGKPRLSLLVIFTAAAGLCSAPAGVGLARGAVFLAATSCLVAAANTLNCWLEKEIDGRMRRTRSRPLPAGRLEPRQALCSGLVLVAVSLAALAASSNGLTVGLGVLALVSYVLVYTPLKRLTPWALFVGAVPGALPPLMGWTAATGGLAAPGWILFAILFGWQLPHFLAIAVYLKDDFRRGGIRVLPLVYGDGAARRHVVAYVLLLVALSLAAQPLGVAGPIYSAAAALLGTGFLALALHGRGRREPERWARGVFAYSLLYLPLVITTLVLDRI
jgi:protoheme IX farnesyltransferase